MRTQTRWLRDCEIAVALALCSIFGLDPESEEAIDFVRYTYRNGQNVPEGNWNENQVYLTLRSVSDPVSGHASHETNADGTITQTKSVPLSCLLTFYGPDSIELAEQARSGIMLDTGYGSPRYVLRSHRLVPVGWPDNPVTMPEALGGTWRMRSDLRVRLNLLQVDNYPFEPLREPPRTTIRVRAGDDTSNDARLGNGVLGKMQLHYVNGKAEEWEIFP